MPFSLRWLMIAAGCLALMLMPACLDKPLNTFTYGSNPAVYTKGVAIAANTPSVSGVTASSYSISPALPSGLALSAATGVITGTPTLAVPVATYVVTAVTSSGNLTCSLKITVNDATVLTILSQPSNQSVAVGQSALFTVSAVGPGTLSYQWSKNGTAIPGATSTSYATPAAVLADSGATFAVGVSDSLGGSATSTAATLTVVTTLPGTWVATNSDLGAGRAFHTATLLPLSGKVLIAGGFNGASLASEELYDPATDTFTATTGSMSSARDSHTATLLLRGKVLITGGNHFGSSISSAELYDPNTDTFNPTGSMNSPRASHTATLLADGKVLVVGGRNGAAYSLTAELYDPLLGTFTLTGSLVGARATHTATLLSNGKVLIAGGFSGSNLASAELYDPLTGTFTATTTSMASARAYHTATVLTNGTVLLVGGTAAPELYNPTTGLFVLTGSPVTARDHWHSAALLPSGKVLIAGGVGSVPSILSSAELYDSMAGTFSATGGLSTAREAHTATLLGSGKVLVVGGAGSGFPRNGELYQ